MIPTDSKERKDAPLFTGCMAYFPLALLEVARLSRTGNDKHNPGEPLHWSRDKSSDHGDCLCRHQLEYDKKDKDGVYHAVMVAWRALAQLQLLLEDDDYPRYMEDPDLWYLTPSNLETVTITTSDRTDDQGMNPETIWGMTPDEWAKAPPPPYTEREFRK